MKETSLPYSLNTFQFLINLDHVPWAGKQVNGFVEISWLRPPTNQWLILVQTAFRERHNNIQLKWTLFSRSTGYKKQAAEWRENRDPSLCLPVLCFFKSSSLEIAKLQVQSNPGALGFPVPTLPALRSPFNECPESYGAFAFIHSIGR